MPDRHPVARLPRRLVIILTLILLLAAFFRFWQLGSFPPGFYHDEAYNSLDALSLTQGKTFPQFYEGWELYAQDAHAERPPTETRFPLFFEGNYGREPFHIYLMALSVKLFGPTPFAIRAVPALFGVLAVLTTFLAAKALFRPPTTDHRPPITIITPLAAAFALAILFPAVHFSRFGLRAMLFVPVETLAVYFFWKAVNYPITQSPISRSTLYFLISGFLVGFGLYIYAAARLFPLLFIVFVPVWFWRDRAALRAHWLNVGLMGGTAVLTALPLLIFFWQYPYFFVFRIAYVANKGKGAVEGKPYLTWLLNVPRVIVSFFWRGETHLRHNLPGRPYLDPIQIIFFLTGIFSIIRRLFQPRIFFLFLWLAVMLLPTIMSGDAPHFGRMTGAAPVVAIFIGLGVDTVYSVIGNRLSVIGKRSPITGYRLPITVYGLLITVLLLSAAWTGYDYFVRYANHPQIEADFYLPDWQMGQYAAQMSEDAIIYLTPAQEELATIYFALADPDRLQNYTGSETLLPLGVPGRESLYLVRPFDPLTLPRLQTIFPDGTVDPAADNYTPFHVSADAPRNLAQNRTDHSFAGKIRLAGWTESREADSVTFTLFWQAEDEMAQDYTAFIHLIDETGQPVAQIDRPPDGRPTNDWLPGEIIMDSFTIPLPPDLPEGGYTWITGFYYLPTLERLGKAATIESADFAD
ncbi:MAG TPA: hypothetical protein ENK32_09125 [Anaerolineae bacterium]|nr:hypothetical protein [Anaerolineae bacterium]